MITVPYNEATDRYEIELWGYSGSDLYDRLEEKGRASLASGELVARPDLIRGNFSDFDREGLDDKFMVQVHPENTMHPVLPLHVEAAWSDASGKYHDSLDGANYQYEFNMIVRGWDNFIGVGISPNPHGGVGFLEYRNLLSNYGRYSGMKELRRQIEPWMFDAFGHKADGTRYENFFSSRLHGSAHPEEQLRHRPAPAPRQPGSLLHDRRPGVDGGRRLVQDAQRERCFEIRTLRAGHFAMLKGGNLHGLFNSTDVDIFVLHVRRV